MDDAPRIDEGGISRRSSLLKAGGFLAAALTAGACGSESGPDASGSTTGSGPAGVSSGAVSCVLSPEQTEGPYYISGEKVRRDVTEGKPGTPLALHLAVVDASTCRAIRGAAVDIWHCDAAGVYSGYANGGGGGGGHASPTDQLTFLRGIQRTDSSGRARSSCATRSSTPPRARR
jgi:protocatechuate 3,4-dioxygenase beta subunit